MQLDTPLLTKASGHAAAAAAAAAEVGKQLSQTCIAAEHLAQGASSNGDGAQAAAGAPILTREGTASAAQRVSLAGGKERLQHRPQPSCDSSDINTAPDGPHLEEDAGQVAPGRCSQAAGKARPQQPHRISSDPDHAPGVSSEPLPAEAGNRLSHSQGGQAEERVRLQRPHELIGRELFITASMLNHSCNPNCLVVREQGHASIVTQRPIQVHYPSTIPSLCYIRDCHPQFQPFHLWAVQGRVLTATVSNRAQSRPQCALSGQTEADGRFCQQEGAEANISYVDISLPLAARRRELQRNFFFLCKCPR